MFATAILAPLLLAQGATAIMVEQETERVDAAYETLAQGDARGAIERLEALRAENPGDPALLINLGAAYAAVGDLARAEQAYRDALASEDRYNLELADGRWIDSRSAARMALASLDRQPVQ